MLTDYVCYWSTASVSDFTCTLDLHFVNILWRPKFLLQRKKYTKHLHNDFSVLHRNCLNWCFVLSISNFE